jgi:outer membrane protein W
MKTIRHFTLSVLAMVATAFAFALPSRAQTSDTFYSNIDWQFNFPINNSFAEKGSGWGMNFEGGYYLTENLAIGGFLAYHSNHKYIPRQTIALGDNSSLNTDQQHTLFQLPFGVAGRYTFDRDGMFQPYISLKTGPQYAKLKTTFNAFQNYDNTWGFYISPEVGINIYPWAYQPGIHVAAYYSYATNKGSVLTYGTDGMSNFGLRVGIAF